MGQKTRPVTQFLLIIYEFDCTGDSFFIWEYNAVLRLCYLHVFIYEQMYWLELQVNLVVLVYSQDLEY